MLRRLILFTACLGTLLFSGLFVVSWVHPIALERVAREAVRLEVERRVGERIESLTGSRMVALAQKALGRTDDEIARVRKQLADNVPAKVAEGIARMLNKDCECRRKLERAYRRDAEDRVGRLEELRDRLAGFVEDAYATVRDGLLRELRIFSGSNAAAFALLGLVAWVKKRATVQLLLPAIVLVGAVAITAGFYVFHQDWLHTVLHRAWVGWAYAGWLVAVTLLLGDIVLNRARVTSSIAGSIGGGPVSPC